jgi:hypothetical protein
MDEQEEIPFGILHGTAPHLPKQKDAFITNSFNKQQKPAIRSKKATINFPYVSQTPVSEYDTNSGLFSKAFPWLFPGGRVISINSEIQNLLFLTGLRTYYYMKMAVLPKIKCGLSMF